MDLIALPEVVTSLNRLKVVGYIPSFRSFVLPRLRGWGKKWGKNMLHPAVFPISGTTRPPVTSRKCYKLSYLMPAHRCFGSRRSPVRIRAPRSALRANPAFGCWISLKGPFDPRLAGAGFAKKAGNGSRGQSHKCANFCANFDAHPAYLDVLERARCAFQPDVLRIFSTVARKNAGCV